MRRRIVFVAAAAVLAVGISLAVTSPWSAGPHRPGRTFALWDDANWAGVRDMVEEEVRAPFHATATPGGACAWVGPRAAFAWPAGYRVRLDPVELIDPHGHVIARDNQPLTVYGGSISGAETAAFPVCGPTGGLSVESVSIPPPRPRSTTRYPLWSDGWNPGEAGMTAAAVGAFHAALVPGGICAWLGYGMRPYEWPAGWTVRFYPDAQLLDASGKIVAVDGEVVTLPGGVIAPTRPSPHFPCTQGTRTVRSVFAVEGPPEH